MKLWHSLSMTFASWMYESAPQVASPCHGCITAASAFSSQEPRTQSFTPVACKSVKCLSLWAPFSVDVFGGSHFFHTFCHQLLAQAQHVPLLWANPCFLPWQILFTRTWIEKMSPSFISFIPFLVCHYFLWHCVLFTLVYPTTVVL